MTVQELIDLLQKIDCPTADVFICDYYQTGHLEDHKATGILFDHEQVIITNEDMS